MICDSATAVLFTYQKETHMIVFSPYQQTQPQLSADRIADGMAGIPVPTYDMWCTSTAATSAMPAGSAVPFIKPPSCTEVILLSNTMASVPTTCTLQCVYLLVSHVLASVSVEHFTQLGPGAAFVRWGGRGEDLNGTASSALPLPPAVQLLQQPVFDMLRSLLARYGISVVVAL